MDINNNENVINRLSNFSSDQLNEVDISFHLVRKQTESDSYYNSLEVQLAPNVKEWLRDNIVKSLNELKQEDDSNNKVFLVGDYNHEINVNDSIARFELSSDLVAKKSKLIDSLRNSDPEYVEKYTNFQIVKLTYDEKDVFFCFYRGTRKNTSKKKWAIKNSNEFNFVDTTMIDLGGVFDFFIIDNYIFILDVKKFEYAFNYRDHIDRLRDEKLTEIISMPFFDDEKSNKSIFEESCKKFFYSRGLAQIKPETLHAIQEKFEERCIELAQIRENAPRDEVERMKYIEKFGTLWNLFDYIDVDEYKIVFKEGDSPKVLIHFFADKIVKSFLTEDFKVAVSYE